MFGFKTLHGPSDCSKTRQLATDLLTTLYELYYCSYKHELANKRIQNTPKTALQAYVLCGVLALQLMSLVFPTRIAAWSQFDYLSDWLSLSRLDYILAKFRVLQVGCLLLCSVLLLCVLIFFLLYARLYLKREVSLSRFHYTFFLPLTILEHFLFTPVLSVLMGVSILSLFKTDSSAIYPGMDANVANVGLLGLGVVPFIGVVLLLQLFQVHFTFNQLNSRVNSYLYSRADGSTEALKNYIIFLMLLSHFVVHPLQEQVHLGILCSLSVIQCYMLLYYMPFYRREVTFANVCVFYLVCVSSIAQFTAYFVNSGLIVVFTVFLVYPLNLWLIWMILIKREEYIRTHYKRTNTLHSVYQYELLVRQLLFDYFDFKSRKKLQEKSDCEAKLSSMYNKMTELFRTCQFHTVLEYIYVLTVKKDIGLARLKLTKAAAGVFSFETSYHIYKYIREQQEALVQPEDCSFLRFQVLYNNVADLDVQLCRTQLTFWRELSRPHPKVDLLEINGRLTDALLEKTREEAENLVKLYSNNQRASRILGMFLLDMLNEQERGNELLSKAESMKQKGQRFNFHDESSALVVVSAEYSTIGQIVFLNDSACQLLQMSNSLTETVFIQSFLPKPLNTRKGIANDLRKFVWNCQSSELSLPEFPIFEDWTGFAVEVELVATLAALDSMPYFVLLARKLPMSREFAYYDNTGVILGNTRGFAKLLEYKNRAETANDAVNLEGVALAELVPQFAEFYTQHGLEKIFALKPQVYSYFREVQFAGHQFSVLYVSSSMKYLKVQSLQCSSQTKTPSYSLEPSLSTLKGILKKPRGKKQSIRQVTIILEPIIFIVDETDFAPGTRKVGNSNKDLDSISKDELVDDIQDPAELKEILNKANFIDLKDITMNDLLDSVTDPTPDTNEPVISRQKSVVSSKASSSGSITSQSFASTQYGDSIRTSLIRSINMFKLLLVITMLLVLSSIIGTSIYFSRLITAFPETIMIEQLGNRLILVGDLSYYSRELSIAVYFQQETTEWARLVLDTALQLKTVNENLGEILHNFEDPNLFEYLNKKTHPVLELYNGQIIQRELNQDDVISYFVSNAISLAENPAWNSPEFFFVYRNGLVEVANIVNSTIYFVDTLQAQKTDEALFHVSLFCYSGLSIIALCFLIIILPSLRSIEVANISMWRLFYLIPCEVLAEITGKNEDRLETLHRMSDEGTTEESCLVNPQDRLKIQPRRKWPRLIAHLALYYLTTIGYFLLFYTQILSPFGSLAVIVPDTLHWSAQRLLTVTSSYTWLREVHFQGTDLGYFHLVPEFQHVFDAETQVELDLEVLKYSETMLIDTYRKFSGEVFLLVYDEAAGVTTNKGIHAAVSHYASNLRWSLETLTHGSFEGWEDLNSELEVLVTELLDLKKEVIAYFESQISSFQTYIVLITVCYSILIILMLLCYYIPLFESYKADMNAVWSLTRVINIDHKRTILDALKQAENSRN